MLLAVFSALCFGASAQITITSATFPTAGDTLMYATDNAPYNVNTVASAPGGGNQIWDLSTLQISQTSETIYQPASVGINELSFPGAGMVVIGQAGETYYKATSTSFQALGYAGADPAGLGLSVLAKFNPPVAERRSPLSFFDIYQQSTDLSLPFSTAQIPDTFFQGFPKPDSIRVRIHTDRLEVVDGWGDCTIPGGTYPVLRQKRTDYNTTNLDAYLGGFLGWVDISQFIPGGGAFGNFIGTDTTITYRFLSGTEKEEIAIATMSNDLSNVVSVRYKNNATVDASEPGHTPGSANIQAQPNPAVEFVNFNCSNLPRDNYTLKIYDFVGKVVWKGEYALHGNKVIRLELDDFKKGAYLYSLSDGDGNIIGTKRLVVLKP